MPNANKPETTGKTNDTFAPVRAKDDERNAFRIAWDALREGLLGAESLMRTGNVLAQGVTHVTVKGTNSMVNELDKL